MVEHKISKTSKKVQRERISRVYSGAVQLLALVIVVYLFFIIISKRTAWEPGAVIIDKPDTLQYDEVRRAIMTAQERHLLFLVRRDNNILYPKKYITKTVLEQFPRIASLEINRGWEGIHYHMVERLPAYFACVQEEAKTIENCWYMDTEGFLFDTAPVFSSGVYTTFVLTTTPNTLPYRPFDFQLLQQMNIFTTGLVQRYGGLIDAIEVTSHDVRVTIQSLFGYPLGADAYLLLDSAELTQPTGAAAVFERLELVRDKGPFLGTLQTQFDQFQYLDMRFSEKFYYKFYE